MTTPEADVLMPCERCGDATAARICTECRQAEQGTKSRRKPAGLVTQPMVQRGSVIEWAEAEAEGESYIPWPK